jgi:hypothetical protein
VEEASQGPKKEIRHEKNGKTEALMMMFTSNKKFQEVNASKLIMTKNSTNWHLNYRPWCFCQCGKMTVPHFTALSHHADNTTQRLE